MDADELRAWLADAMRPWELTPCLDDPGWHELGFDAAFVCQLTPPATRARSPAPASVSTFEDMGRREARGLMARYLERHDERRAWLDRRIGQTLTPDAEGLRRLWTWWIAWRATGAHRNAPSQLPEWFAHILGGWSQWTTGPEVELADAASFLLADARMAADATLHWELELRKSSIWVHEPVLVGRGFRDINPRHFLLSSARTPGIRLDTPEHDDAPSWVAEPGMLVGCLDWGFRPLPRNPGDGPYDLELHPQSVILVPDDDSGLDIKELQRRIAKLDGVDSTKRDRGGRIYVSVPYRADPAALARAIRAEIRG